MSNRQPILHRFHRSVRQLASRATSVTITVGVLALATAVPPAEAQQQESAARVPAAVLERYVGEYLRPDGTSWAVKRVGDTLFHVSSSQRFVYAPLSETKFSVGPVVTAEFVIDEAGGVTQILSDGVGLEYRLRRKGSPPESPAASRAPAAAAVRVPRSVLERYVGTYEYILGQMDRTDLKVVIRLEGDNLIREGAGPAAILTPISETRFLPGNNPAFVVEFVVDDAGVALVMGLGYQQLVVRRTSKR